MHVFPSQSCSSDGAAGSSSTSRRQCVVTPGDHEGVSRTRMTTSRSPITSALAPLPIRAATLNLWSPTGSGDSSTKIGSPDGVSVSVNESDGASFIAMVSSSIAWSEQIARIGVSDASHSPWPSPSHATAAKPAGHTSIDFACVTWNCCSACSHSGVSADGTSRSTAYTPWHVSSTGRTRIEWANGSVLIRRYFEPVRTRMLRDSCASSPLSILKSRDVPGRSMHSVRSKNSNCGTIRSNLSSTSSERGQVLSMTRCGPCKKRPRASGRPAAPAIVHRDSVKASRAWGNRLSRCVRSGISSKTSHCKPPIGRSTKRGSMPSRSISARASSRC